MRAISVTVARRVFTTAAEGFSPVPVGREAHAFFLLSVKANESVALVPQTERDRLAGPVFRAYAESLLADDILSEAEERVFAGVWDAFAIDLASPQYRDLLYRLQVAKVNDGRLETLDSPRLLAQPGEAVHMEMGAALLKEVSLREWQGGSAGYSFRVAKGVRFNTGRVRGKSVVVGTEIQIEDEGALSVTSNCIVFLGSRKTVDIPYKKLVGMQVFSDGITLQSSSRQKAVMIRLADGAGEAVAATVIAAMQTSL
jgi:hypothetical protein